MTTADRIPPAMQRIFDATNAGDSAAFVQSFAPNGVVDDWGREFAGHDAIAGWNARENIGVQSHFAIHDVIRDGTAYVATVTVNSNGYNGGGTFTVEVDGDLISRFTIR